MTLSAEQRARLRSACMSYLAAVDRGARPRLTDLVAQHPDLERELAEFAAMYQTAEHGRLPAGDAVPTPREAGAVQGTLAAYFGTAALDSILGAADRRGLTPAELAGRLGIGLDVLGKLERRLIRAATAPAAFLTRLAAETGVSPAALRAYLDGGPRPATAGAMLYAAAPPATPEAQSFADALRASALTDPAARDRWLALTDGTSA
jgi:hypothetical protein